jgi:hypothetical protein
MDFGLGLSKGIPQAISNISNIQSLQERAKRLRMDEQMQPLQIKSQEQANKIQEFQIKKAAEEEKFNASPVDLNQHPVIRGMTPEVKKYWMDWGQSQGLANPDGTTTQGNFKKILGSIESDTEVFKKFTQDTTIAPLKNQLDVLYGEYQKAQEKDPSGEKTVELGNQYMALYGQYQQTLGKVEEGAKSVQLNQTYQKLVKSGDLEKIATENPQVAKALEIAFQNKDVAQVNKIIDEYIKAKTGTTATSTDDIKEYERAVTQGYKGSFIDYMKEMKKASAANTNVNVDVKGQTKEQEAIGEARGKQYTKINEAASGGADSNMTLEKLESYLNEVATGKATPAVTSLMQWGQALGAKIDPKWNYAQALDAVSKEFALTFRNPAGGTGMPGNFSDQDRKYLESIAPGLGKSVQSNKLIIDAMRKINNRKIETLTLAEDWLQKTGSMKGFTDYMAKYAKTHPLFTQSNSTKSGNRFTIEETK